MIKKLILALGLSIASGSCIAAGAAMQYLDAKVDLEDRPSLQNGAKLYVNYCLGCHALSYMRYNRVGADLELSDEQVSENLLFSSDKVVDLMDTAMRGGDAEQWFGITPPDLSVIARARGADYLYSYLVTFYRDANPARPFGVNNVVLSGASMPHVMWPLQGEQRYVADEVDGEVVSEQIARLSSAGDEIIVHRNVVLDSGETVHATDRLELASQGRLAPGEFRSEMRDLVNFLVYASEPAQLVRYDIGIWVLLFLAVLFVLSRMMYKEFWRDVH